MTCRKRGFDSLIGHFLKYNNIMNFSLLRQQFLQDNPGFVLPKMVSSLSELKSSIEDWLDRYQHRQPKVVSADGDPPLCYFGFRAFYIDDNSKEVDFIVVIPIENVTANDANSLMSLRSYFDNKTTYTTKYKKEYLAVKDDGTVILPHGKRID